MNVIEKSRFVDEDGKISIKDRLSATLDFGSDWYGRMEAQQVVTQRLSRALGDHHILLRNIPIPGIGENEPYMILVSPQGIRVIMTYPIRGVFRANEGEWLKLNQRSRSFVRTKPNLQLVALNIQKQAQRLLDVQNFGIPIIESVLIFTHPRTLIDGSRPVCRVVSADAIEYFAANLEQLPVALTPQQVHAAVDAILYPQLPEPQSADDLITDPLLKRSSVEEPTFKPFEEPIRDPSAESFYESEAESSPAFLPDTFEEFQEPTFEPAPVEDPYQPSDEFYLEDDVFQEFQYDDDLPDEPIQETTPSKTGMTGGQWTVIGILVVIEIVVILIFAYIVLRDLGMI
jgi:hypothetical protein